MSLEKDALPDTGGSQKSVLAVDAGLCFVSEQFDPHFLQRLFTITNIFVNLVSLTYCLGGMYAI